jgi:hypothetical protein
MSDEQRAQHFADARLTTDAQRAGRSASEQARQQMIVDLNDGWKSPEQRLADARQTTDAQRPRGMSDAEFEYRRMCRDLQDAWKPKPVSTADGSIKPLPFGAWLPGPTRGEGMSCSTGQGEAGTWQQSSDGYMYCVPQDRSELPLGNDALPRTMSPQDAARAEMCNYLENAWRPK